MSTPEGRVKTKVKRALGEHYRFMPVQNGMGAPGLDFFCCIEGLFVAIETKVPGKPLTPRQYETAKAIARSGGLVFVIRDDADIYAMFAKLAIWASRQRGPGIIYDKLRHGD